MIRRAWNWIWSWFRDKPTVAEPVLTSTQIERDRKMARRAMAETVYFPRTKTVLCGGPYDGREVEITSQMERSGRLLMFMNPDSEELFDFITKNIDPTETFEPVEVVYQRKRIARYDEADNILYKVDLWLHEGSPFPPWVKTT